MNVPRIQSPDAITELPPTTLDRLATIVGPDYVTTADAKRKEAGRDWWPIGLVWAKHDVQAALPAAVVAPTTSDQVCRVLALANAESIPVTTFAGRSGVCGASLPVRGGISLDVRRLDKVTNIDTENLLVTTEAGVFGPDLEKQLEGNGLTVGHYPQSFEISTVGGWISCRGAGQYSNRYGKIEDMVKGLDVALANGQLLHTNAQSGSATGPDLARLFIGAEGTLGVITSATLQLRPLPSTSQKQAFSFASFADGLDAQRRLFQQEVWPACLRLYDDSESARHFNLSNRHALIVICEGEPAATKFQAATVRAVIEECEGAQPEDPILVDTWLAERNDVSALHNVIDQGLVVDTIEIAGPWSQLPNIYSDAKQKVLSVEGAIVCSAHSSHSYLSGGCLYFTFAGMPGGTLDDIDRFYTSCWDVTMATVLAHGGTISHHHGIGLNRARFLEQELGPTGMQVLRSLKSALDPAHILNPGKLGLDQASTTLWPPPELA